ncbi:MAG: response regulator [Candidatus Brocadiae bacterium]|nr:response regulator [Candidatus Brocadiia bacterium]
MQEHPFYILLVEDNQDHAELVKRTLEKTETESLIFHVDNGESALDFLYRRGIYQDNLCFPKPNLILLDLRLPKIDGLEVLRAIKQEERFLDIPVVILTSSDTEQDLTKAYRYHANSYLTKPVDFIKFSNMMKDFGDYWLYCNKTVDWNKTIDLKKDTNWHKSMDRLF